MSRIGSWQTGKETDDRREQIRLELVGLAAEIATVGAQAVQDSPCKDTGAQEADRARRCRASVHLPLLVLSERTRFEHLTPLQLTQALQKFRALQREIVELRYGPPVPDSYFIYLNESADGDAASPG